MRGIIALQLADLSGTVKVTAALPLSPPTFWNTPCARHIAPPSLPHQSVLITVNRAFAGGAGCGAVVGAAVGVDDGRGEGDGWEVAGASARGEPLGWTSGGTPDLDDR